MARALAVARLDARADSLGGRRQLLDTRARQDRHLLLGERLGHEVRDLGILDRQDAIEHLHDRHLGARSEEHTSELQSLMRISYAVFCLKQKNQQTLKKK